MHGVRSKASTQVSGQLSIRTIVSKRTRRKSDGIGVEFEVAFLSSSGCVDGWSRLLMLWIEAL